MPIQVNPCVQDHALVLKQSGIEQSASLLLNSLVLQNMVAASKLQWSPDYAFSWIAPWNWEIASWPWTQPSQGLFWQFK